MLLFFLINFSLQSKFRARKPIFYSRDGMVFVKVESGKLVKTVVSSLSSSPIGGTNPQKIKKIDRELQGLKDLCSGGKGKARC